MAGLVSFLARTRNRPKLLHRAMRSICVQTYNNIEIVVVNDGGCKLSDLATANRPLTYVEHERSKRAAAAAKTALRHVKGDYGLFLDDDDDDEILPDHIDGLAVALKENPECGVAHSDSWMMLGNRDDMDLSRDSRRLHCWDFDLADLVLMR